MWFKNISYFWFQYSCCLIILEENISPYFDIKNNQVLPIYSRILCCNGPPHTDSCKTIKYTDKKYS
jgi:hypothetical protein